MIYAFSEKEIHVFTKIMKNVLVSINIEKCVNCLLVICLIYFVYKMSKKSHTNTLVIYNFIHWICANCTSSAGH